VVLLNAGRLPGQRRVEVLFTSEKVRPVLRMRTGRIERTNLSES